MFSEGNEVLTIAISNDSSEIITSWLQQAEEIEVIVDENPIQLVEEGKAAAAVWTKGEFNEELEGNTPLTIEIHADETGKNGSIAFELLNNYLLAKKIEIVNHKLIDKGVDPQVLEPFTIKFENITGEDTGSLFLLTIFGQLVIGLAVMMGGFPAANDLFAGEKERKTMEALIMTPVKRIHIVTGKWLTIATLSTLSGLFAVLALIVSVQFIGENIAAALNLGEHLVGFIASLTIGIVFFSLFIASLQLILSLIANNMKEASSYISPVSMIMMLPYFLLLGISVNELNNIHFLIPFFNVFALIKQIMYGIIDPMNVFLVVISLSILIAITFFIASLMFKKSKWVLGK